MLQQPHSTTLQTPRNARNNVQLYKISIFTKFSKIYGIYNILLQTIFRTVPHFLTLGITVPNIINTHEFCLEHHIWLKIQNSITIFCDYLWLFKIFVNLNLFYTLSCLHSITNCKFKNSLTNNCCFGTSTMSPWAKVTFLYMYFFQYANH